MTEKLSEYDKRLETYYIGYHSRDDEVKALKSENQTLKEQNAENARWAARHKATKEEWGKQLTKAEAEVKTLREYRDVDKRDLDISFKKIDGLESRLAKAQELLLPQNQPDTIRGDDDELYIELYLFSEWLEKVKKPLGGES
jgi:chromosome segregation ATPase